MSTRELELPGAVFPGVPPFESRFTLENISSAYPETVSRSSSLPICCRLSLSVTGLPNRTLTVRNPS